MKTRIFTYGIAILTGIMLFACGQNSGTQEEYEYFPFQTERDGNWGMISPSGEVLFAEEFKNEPTMAINGRFMVKNGDGLWEIYTTDKKPQKIGGEYLSAGLFYEDVAPVVEKDKCIQLIDRDGNVKVTLDKIDGKPVSACTNFYHGVAMVVVDDCYGAIDVSGKPILQPQYSIMHIDNDGKIIALHKKYQDMDWEKRVFTIYDRKGNEIASIKTNKFTGVRYVSTSYRMYNQCIGDGIMVAVDKDGKTVEGLLGFNGEWLLKPVEKRVTYHELRGDYLTYSNSDGRGLTNLKGDNLIRAKFYELSFADDGLLRGKKTSKDRYELYNLEGEKVGKEDYENIWLFHNGENYTFAKVGTGDYVLLDRKGNEMKLEAEVYVISNGTRDDTVFYSAYQEPEPEGADEIPEVVDSVAVVDDYDDGVDYD